MKWKPIDKDLMLSRRIFQENAKRNYRHSDKSVTFKEFKSILLKNSEYRKHIKDVLSKRKSHVYCTVFFNDGVISYVSGSGKNRKKKQENHHHSVGVIAKNVYETRHFLSKSSAARGCGTTKHYLNKNIDTGNQVNGYIFETA